MLASQRRQLNDILLKLHKDATKLRESKKFQNDTERHEKSSGVTSEYGKMSYEDALYWLAWLNRWKKNNVKLAEKFLK